MYSRITNMHRIEDFGTISSETCLKDIPYPKEKINCYSLLFAANTFSTRGGVGNRRKGPYLQVPRHKPLSKPLYEPSTVFHFTVHKHTQLGRERRRQRRIRERKERRQKTHSVGRRQALTIFNLKLLHHTSFRPHAHTHRKHRDGQTEN